MWKIVYREIGFHLFLSSFNNIEILVALADGESSGPWEEFMAEDFCDEDVLGHVYWCKAVAADSGVRRFAGGAGFQGRAREPKAAETYLGS